MLDTFKKLTANQFEAALCTLNVCIDKCPETAWHERVANLKFCQVVFHTLFYTDYYLGQNKEAFRRQPFHQDNQQFFRDYEELEDRAPVLLYDKPSIKKYLHHCRTKAAEVIAAETTQSLSDPCGFERRSISRAELHIYNMRHIQHHAAQLSLRLRLDRQTDIPWVGSGWREI
ncbi:MAG: DinB family protein [Gemmataceae bacterium]|nr:DinB family protein [Gemmataceae bacterium]MCI0740562.1 DinB family protein [Gemmataceae bacterium]